LNLGKQHGFRPAIEKCSIDEAAFSMDDQHFIWRKP
jgi:hypothetical protein